MNKPITKKIIYLSLVACCLLLVASTTFAQGPENVNDVLAILNRLINWMFTLLLVLAILFIIAAAYNYLMAGGDPDKAKKAKDMILYAAIAIAVGLVARGIEFLVRQLILGSPF
ncbi:MAG: pilin [Patescibacteria group bacterium]